MRLYSASLHAILVSKHPPCAVLFIYTCSGAYVLIQIYFGVKIRFVTIFQGVNSVELAMDAITHIQKRFYQDYPPHPSETDYLFATPSTMKPTQIKVSIIVHDLNMLYTMFLIMLASL